MTPFIFTINGKGKNLYRYVFYNIVSLPAGYWRKLLIREAHPVGE
jgi:hypothetical protein